MEEEALTNLRIIDHYLSRAIDEHQKILNSHFDLKALYTKELEQLSQMSLIKRFSLRNDLYEKVMGNSGYLENLDYFLRPLFNREPDKLYNMNKVLELQKPIRSRDEEEDETILNFDEGLWQEEQERLLREKLKTYRESLNVLLTCAASKGQISLMEMKEAEEFDTERLIPSTEVFKEIMVELLKNQSIDMGILKKERSENISDHAGGFQLNEMLLDIAEKDEALKKVSRIETYRIEDGNTVVFENARNADGNLCTIRCSNVLVRLVTE